MNKIQRLKKQKKILLLQNELARHKILVSNKAKECLELRSRIEGYEETIKLYDTLLCYSFAVKGKKRIKIKREAISKLLNQCNISTCFDTENYIIQIERFKRTGE